MNSPAAAQGTNPYERWTELLQLWERFDDLRDVSFYAALAEESQRPVVEVGVGWGRAAEQIRPDVGVDNAANMLAAARKRLGDADVTLMEADFETYELAEPAAFSYAPLNSFDHITDLEQLTRIFANVRRNTLPGGRFAFDAELHTLHQLEDDGLHVDGYDGEIVIQSTYRLLDGPKMVYEFIAFVDWLDENGAVTARRYFPPLPGRAITPDQYRGIFSATGWRVLEAWGGFRGEPLSEDGRRQVWLLEATGGGGRRFGREPR
jgi:Methyltransferase domain